MNSKNRYANMNPEIFYLKGALRDGCLTTGFTIKFAQKYREWLKDVILPLINKNFDVKLKENCIYYQRKKWPFWYIAVSNKKLWQCFNKINKLTPKNKKEQKFYIIGFWDADGGCPKNPVANKKNYIKFTQKDKQSLEELKNMLEKEVTDLKISTDSTKYEIAKIKDMIIRISEELDNRAKRSELELVAKQLKIMKPLMI